MKSFAGASKNEYCIYLQKKGSWKRDLYNDPDLKVEGEFYSKLVEFLNKREKDFLGATRHFEYKRTESVAVKGKGYKVPPSIDVIDAHSKNHILYLRSDQFGFSAPRGENTESGAWNIKYPYGKFLSFGGSAVLVSETIYTTRTIGGSFLWPILFATNPRGKKCWWNPYNYYRGIGDYLEDRVDLTLYEIKAFYDLLKKNNDVSIDELKNDNDSIMFCESKLVTMEKNEKDRYFANMSVWLKHFGTFENYINYFMLNDFVDSDYNPIDLVTDKKINENDWKAYREKENFQYIQKKATLDDLEKIFINLLMRTYCRSQMIELYLKKFNIVIN